jgi:hypothetical protein
MLPDTLLLCIGLARFDAEMTREAAGLRKASELGKRPLTGVAYLGSSCGCPASGLAAL